MTNKHQYSAEIKVRSYECDSFGHVNNAVYLQYLEAARCDYMTQAGISFNDFEKWGKFPFVTGVEIKYKHAAKPDDILIIYGKMGHFKKVSFTIEYEIYNKTHDRVTAVASVSFAFVDTDEKLIPVPDEFKIPMSQLHGE